MIIKKIIEKLSHFENVRIIRLVIGLGYTAAHTEMGLGLSYTMISRKNSCTVNPAAGSFAGRTIKEALEIINNDPYNINNTTILIALFNSTIDFDKINNAGSDAVAIMDIKSSDEVFMIGYFEPLIASIKSRCKHLTIIEERHGLTTGEFAEKDWNSDVNIITSTSLINSSFEDISRKCKKSRINCLMGPSTILEPEFFKDYNMNYLAGLKPLNYERIIEIVSEGGGTKLFNKYCEKIVIKC